MKITTAPNADSAVELAARLFIEKASVKPDAPVGLATGGTMDGVYFKLKEVGYHPETKHAFALDDYLGLEPGDPHSYTVELNQKFVQRLHWSGTLHVPGAGDYQGELGADKFEETIRALGPLSVQLLGLGSNGHVAFNEPGSSFESRTRVVRLAEQTRSDNLRFFDNGESVPTHALTQGLATIRQATSLILIVLGERKKPALLRALETPGPEVPLAALLDHPDITLVTDLEL